MKKLNKFFAVLVALAMMATLALTAAFAENPPTQVDDVDLTKTLTKNEGTTTPDADFVFQVKKNTTLGDSHAQDVQNQTFEYDEDAALVQTKDLDTLIEAALAAQPAGLYVYDVFEDKDASTQNSTGNTYTYSDNVYRVRVYKSVVDGVATYKYTVAAVSNYGTENESEAKIPVTPGSGEDADKYVLDFENKYVKTAVVDPDGKPDDPDTPNKEDDNDGTGLLVQKNVANDSSNLYADKEFDITMDVTAPAVSTLNATKTGYAYKVMKVKATGEEEEVTAKAGTLVPGTPATVALKTNERIVFTDLDIGAVVNVKEADYTADFAPTATLNGTAKDKDAVLAGIDATAAESGAKLYIVNTANNGTTPTGILINNLPYIALALVAIGGLVAYVVIRRRDEENA